MFFIFVPFCMPYIQININTFQNKLKFHQRFNTVMVVVSFISIFSYYQRAVCKSNCDSAFHLFCYHQLYFNQASLWTFENIETLIKCDFYYRAAFINWIEEFNSVLILCKMFSAQGLNYQVQWNFIPLWAYLWL